ncbi:MAG TPA: TM2 domain-containing protein [Actinobacteria bacterium]|nr:TM2 domain-containing protein [Actinomycetota bacterium]
MTISPDGQYEWNGTQWVPRQGTPPPPPGYPAPGYGTVPAPKSKVVAGILGILLGGFGVHRFYLGYVGIGIAQIVVTFVTFGVGSLWGLIEGILILVGSSITTDAQGRPLAD